MRRTNIQNIPTPTKWIAKPYYDPEIFERSSAQVALLNGELFNVGVDGGSFADVEPSLGVSLGAGSLDPVVLDTPPHSDTSGVFVSFGTGSLDSIVVSASDVSEAQPHTTASIQSGSLNSVGIVAPDVSEPYNTNSASLVSGSLDDA